ncbi:MULTISPECIES: PilC/PilY family type IV pilus protein [Pseudoxanthomonas]|uniref:Type IV pilus assembly protein PilY1 n=1 Tax=Pseudoxanthomonas winnipegensis TaxID=2480810 RepID=A0AAW8GDV3_9GAMM|nr:MULTISPECIES: PilC/PilY family type IV pilus protein [Pseudoxanthomonas]MDQ1119783.1 type IV pilus assembly protein PilY1 [Pseudoxanthomonas winnipegensis]MDQ1132983.1 type IV pilus assembly protein PilY1 [Pseudoxanthomonas winnipegensis]MDR6137014.1 type IV pilus assembly protein PilY1 [Pseudoxanthomonas sp. SORGH_AS_0997]
MKHRRLLLSSSLLLALAGGAGYVAYSVFAAQGAGTLSQSPLNIETNIKPAFIMGVDDSGSMISDELLFATSSGSGCWNNNTKSFFASDGTPLGSGTCYNKAVSSGVPRADQYGAARDPEYNRAYFNPAVTYLPWQTSDGSYEANSSPTAAKEDVRSNSGTTFDFTKTLDSGAIAYTAGMILFAGTTYLNNDRCSNTPTPGVGAPTNDWITLSSNLTLASNCNIKLRYYPAVVYLSEDATPPPGFDLSKRVLITGAGPKGSNLYKYEYLEGNFTTGGATAVQNFANWWTYHGNRNRATISAMTQSIAEVKDMRVGYFTINKRNAVTMFDLNVAGDRQTLYSNMRALTGNSATPLRQAVRFMGDQFRRKDIGAPVQLSCQKNASMLFTDGYTNDSYTGGGSIAVGDVDGSLPVPLKGSPSTDTIADFASWSYENNIRPDLVAGQVPVPDACSGANPDLKLDCNKNQHVNFYGITLGAVGRVYGVDAAATADPYKNPPTWYATSSMNLQPANVDDIWHAALNTRGEFINAQSPAEIAEAMRRILASVGAGTTPSGSIGLTGARIGAGSLTVVPAYTSTNNSTDWYSTLTAQSVSSNILTGAISYNKLWEATDAGKIPAAASRNLLFGKTSGGVKPTVMSFTSANIGDASALCSDVLTRCSANGSSNGIVGPNSKLKVTLDQAVDYLRGDQSLEKDASTPLRTRSTRLGDLVNSTPVISAAADDYGYANSLRDIQSNGAYTYPYASSYKAYLATKKSLDRPMVYVGANDGFYHAFDGKTGAELFGYAPSASVGHMGNLLFPYNADDKNNQAFRHTFFVDGPSVVSDAYWGSTWKTVIVGGLGAGGRGVFAINVTSPSSVGTGSVLWEVNDSVSAGNIKNNIGYVLGKPVVVPVKANDGTVRWKAIFGNGYNSASNRAVLFVVDVETGAATTIMAKEAGRDAVANGLGNVVVLDRYIGTGSTTGRDGYADTVYAGDQNGAVWKFDLRNNSTQTVPLFVAKDPSGVRQPIMGGFDAASGAGGGVMLYFGTGSFSFEDDKSDKQIQTLYGILDSGSSIDGRSDLQQQTITAETAGKTRAVTSNVVPAGKRGWYLDLGISSGGVVAASGERFVGYPRVDSGLVYFPTYSPESSGSCAGEGINRLYGLNGLSGGAGLSVVRVGTPTGSTPGTGTGALTLSTSGSSPVKDVAVMSTARVAPLTSATPTAAEENSALGARCSMVVQVAGADPLYVPRPCGRQSWRQIR